MNTLTQQHRAQQLLLRRATQAQVAKIWPTLDFNRLDATYPRFAVAAAQLVEANRKTSMGLTVGYIRRFRRLAGVPGDAPLVLAEPLNVAQFQASLHATSVAPLKAATAERAIPDVAMNNALTMTRGSLARLVLNASRETLTQSVAVDEKARGYQRVLGGGGCDFCQMLAGRGGVYGEDTATFEAHDHCGCTAEPVYRT